MPTGKPSLGYIALTLGIIARGHSSELACGLARQLRQLGDVGRDRSRLIIAEQLGGRASARYPLWQRTTKHPVPRPSKAIQYSRFEGLSWHSELHADFFDSGLSFPCCGSEAWL